MWVFDGHCDTISHCYRSRCALRENPGHLDLNRMAGYEGWAQFFAIFASKGHAAKPMWDIFQEEYAVFDQELRTNQDKIVLCRTAQEAEMAWSEGRQAAFLSVEGAELLDCDLQKLKLAHDLGVRAVNLTWNYENALSGSNAESPEKGLTFQGKSFVRRMEELGMLVDVSHLSDPGFWDVAVELRGPIFASHSNSRAVCPHKRNLTDEQFSAIIKSGGVAGLNLCDEFLGEVSEIDTIVRHIEHWFSLGGEKNVSLGGDWDGISGMPKGISGIQDIGKLADRLLQLNYSEERVEGIFYRNLLEVVRKVCIM